MKPDRFGGSLWLVGHGNMGGAMLRRWLAAGLDPSRVTVVERAPRSCSPRDLPDGIATLAPPLAAESPDLLVLAVKPAQLAEVAAMLASVKPGIVVSVLAGVEEATLAEYFSGSTIVRAMPNLPVAIGAGVVALHALAADARQRDDVTALMTPLGLVEWIDDEASFDAVTALAGCGPGFVFRFADALASAGEMLGLGAAQSRRLALATLAGAARMAVDADLSPAALADRVASPGGSTREGLNVLDDDEALVGLMRRTLAASARRNREMADAARG